MYRKELPRIYELRDMLPDALTAKAYFQNLDKSLSEIPQKLRQYRELERELDELDATAWSFMKSEVLPLLLVKHDQRGWQPLFDKLNQVKAYNYLKRAGYQQVRFIPPISVAGRMTPDIEAANDTDHALCEVKTINKSDIEVQRRFSGDVGTITARLSDGFFRKLSATLLQATEQMAAFNADPSIRRIAYVVINFDDALHEYADLYGAQIEEYMAKHPVAGIRVIFDWKPPFDSAML